MRRKFRAKFGHSVSEIGSRSGGGEALARGGKRAKIVFKNHVKIQIVISYVFACNKNKALQLQRLPILSLSLIHI